MVTTAPDLPIVFAAAPLMVMLTAPASPNVKARSFLASSVRSSPGRSTFPACRWPSAIAETQHGRDTVNITVMRSTGDALPAGRSSAAGGDPPSPAGGSRTGAAAGVFGAAEAPAP